MNKKLGIDPGLDNQGASTNSERTNVYPFSTEILLKL